MGAAMRALDWSKTPLGPVETWPQSLRTSVSICLNSAFAILIWWGPELVMLYNDPYHQIISNKHPKALGAPGKEIFPEIWNTIGPMLHRVMHQGEAVRADDLLLFLERNGYSEECYFTFSYSPILDENGVGGVFTPVQETTERVIGERRIRTLSRLAAVRTSKAKNAEEGCKLQAEVLTANSIDVPFAAIYLFDQKGTTARCIATVGTNVSERLAPQLVDVTSQWPPVQSVLSGETNVRECSFVPGEELPKGHWGREVQQFITIPIAQSGGETPKGFLVAGLNPRKRLDESYESFLALVAGHISAAIADAEAFEQERKRAEALAEIDRAKTAFFSNVSHEFRTPLTLMLAPLEEMRSDQSLDLKNRERLELLYRNSIRLQRLVNDLLDFSRIEAGRVQATFEPVDLAQLTNELASGFRSAFDRANLSLNLNLPKVSAPVYVDSDMWEKIVLNLLSNAFKFTLSGGVTVELTEKAGTVRLSVIDSGTGIPASELPKIFQRFHRIEGSRGRSFEGTGIGLALVHELVRIHGGSITVESKEGVGSRFLVNIPTGSSHLPPERVRYSGKRNANSSRVEAFVSEALRWVPEMDRVESAEPFRKPEHRSHPKRHRVLIADDNADMREYISRLLQDNYEIEAVSNGQEALAAIARHRPDLMLTDVMMPVMDGRALIAAVRGNPDTVSVPVLMLSARAGEEAEIEGFEAGADDYITKPFSARELVVRVGSALQIAELRASSEKALRASEARWREVLERTTDSVFVLDKTWRFTFLNANAGSLIAAGRDLLYKNIWDEFPEAVGREFWKQYQRAMNEGVPVQFEEFYPDPLNKWFDVHAYPTDEGIAVFFRDITERRRAEQALRQNEKLAVAGRLAASISHEINNPLESVMNLLFLIQGDTSVSPGTKEYLATAQSELDRVSHIATQTLRFYRQSTKPARTSLKEVLESVVALYERRLRDAEIVVERNYRSTEHILAFAGELRQLFANLIGNALDAIGTGGRIGIRERRSRDWSSGREGIRVTIADSGQGMNTDTLKHLFQPFFSTKETTGTGLGLWVSKEIIEKHGGEIKVRSSQTRHRGSTFQLFFPFDGILKTVPQSRTDSSTAA